MTDVKLTEGQYQALMQRTEPDDCQTDRIKSLRLALEGAEQLRTGRYSVRMTAEMIESAAYVLKVAALKGGKALMWSRMFDREYVTWSAPVAGADLPAEPEALWALLADVLQALEDAGEDPRLEGFGDTPGVRRTPESGKWERRVTWNADGGCRWTYVGGEA